MNVTKFAMNPDAAREQLRAVRKQLHRKADDEYEALRECYTALEKGMVLIDVQEAIRKAPVDAIGRPRLAIARADRRQVELSWSSNRALFTGKRLRRNGQPVNIAIEMDRRPPGGWLRGDTLVPMIPPLVRNLPGCARSNDVRNYILWEVTEWKNLPPIDPYLLRFVRGTLYAVLAEWDLTELERLVMAARAQA